MSPIVWRMRSRRWGSVLVLLAAALVTSLIAAACTSTISGTPTAQEPKEPTPTADPKPPAQPPSYSGARIESRRLGPYVVEPEDVLPDTDTGECTPGPGPRAVPDETKGLGEAFTETEVGFFKRAGYSAGWYTCFSQTDGPGGVLGAFEMYDEPRTDWLVTKMALTMFDPNGTRVEFDDVPDAVVSQARGADGYPYIQALVPKGRMFVYLYCHGGQGEGRKVKSVDELRDTCGELLAAENDRLRDFEPTPVEVLGALDDDPRDLAAKVVEPPGDPNLTDGGYTLEQYGRIADKPEVEVPLLERHGLTEVYSKSGYDQKTYASRWVQLFELRDAAAATKVFRTEFLVVRDWMRANLKNAKQHVLGGVDDVRCHSGWEAGYDNAKNIQQACIFTSGRYFFYVGTYGATDKQADLTDIGKLVSEQLALTPR